MAPTFNNKTTAQEVADHYKSELEGRNVLITGVGPDSLGEETARVLAPYAKTVIIASRTKSKMQAVTETIKKATPSANIIPIELDLSSYEAVKKAAAEVQALDLPIHYVINNAAVAFPATLKRTVDGNEFQFGSNHLGHFLFISRIWPSLLAAKSADFKPRVVAVSSIGHAWATPRLDDVNYETRPEYEKYNSYAQSKLANVLFARGLAKKHAEDVIAFSIHPGGIRTTGLGSAVTKDEFIAMGLMRPDGTWVNPDGFKDVHSGTSTQVYAAIAPEIAAHSGSYLQDTKLDDVAASAASKDPANVETLWELSEKLVGEKFAAKA